MPKPVKKAATKIAKPKRLASESLARAHQAVAEPTGGAQGTELPAKQRREIALKAAKARWSKAQSDTRRSRG